jgi:hypothetical protein
MPSLEIRPLRARKRSHSRSHLHLSSTAPSSPSSPPPITTAPFQGSSSDERNKENKSPDSSISSNSPVDDDEWKKVIRNRKHNRLRDTVWWGYFLLGTTWIVFVLGMGGVCRVWEWSLKSIRVDHDSIV